MASSKSAKVSTGVQSTAGGDQEPKEEKLGLDDAVVNYLNIKDGESGSQQDSTTRSTRWWRRCRTTRRLSRWSSKNSRRASSLGRPPPV